MAHLGSSLDHSVKNVNRTLRTFYHTAKNEIAIQNFVVNELST